MPNFSENGKFSYNDFYGFRDSPFSLIPNPDLFFPAISHLELINVLHYALINKSLITVLTGAPGVGKTQVVLTLLSKIKRDFQALEILNPAISPEELFQTLISKIIKTKDPMPSNKDFILKELKSALTSQEEVFLIIIDEAQLLPIETLEELRLLTNLNEDNKILLQIFLIGQPNLSEKLKDPKLLPLRQRIGVWEELKPLKREEILSYIWFRIREVSSTPNIILDKNIEKPLYKASKGIPRLINKIMDRTLFIAYYLRENKITKRHIKEAIKTFKEELLEF